MSAFTALLLIGETALLLPTAYLLFLTLVGLLYRRPSKRVQRPRSRFAILIPAHNEEVLLPHLLRSIDAETYPGELFDVYVVADNCTDATADVAARHGATVFERQDSILRGKGYALQWLLERVRDAHRTYDALVFLDADCTVSPDFLAVMDGRLQAGCRVVQSYYAVADPARSWVSALRSVALVMMHHTRPKGREVLRLSCGLFGTGMVLHRSVLDICAWNAYGLVEDAEYYLRLTERGIRVSFAPEATVFSPMPSSLKAAESQNMRWERGRLQLAWRYGFRFLWNGLRAGAPMKVDAAMEQLIPPLSVTGLLGVLLLGLSIISGDRIALALGLSINVALAGHLTIGLVAARTPSAVYRSLVFVPWFMLWKLAIYSRAWLPGGAQWVRTQRPHS